MIRQNGSARDFETEFFRKDKSVVWIFMIRPQTPIILCTGFSDTVDENKIKLMGIKELLLKPVSLRDLAGAVYKAVTQAKCARCDGINHTR